MTGLVTQRYPQLLAAALCLGLAAANALRVETAVALLLGMTLMLLAILAEGSQRLAALVLALVLGGWWWGSARLDTIDRSPLSSRVGMAAVARVIATGPPRRGRYDTRQPAVVARFGDLPVREAVLLKLPRGRAPPQGAILDALGQLAPPHGPKNGFDERTWLRRHGVHLVLRVDRWRIVGRRGGLGGVADALRRRLQNSVALGLSGERAALLEGVVLGEDSGLSDELRRRFRAAGLYHLLRAGQLARTAAILQRGAPFQ